MLFLPFHRKLGSESATSVCFCHRGTLWVSHSAHVAYSLFLNWNSMAIIVFLSLSLFLSSTLSFTPEEMPFLCNYTCYNHCIAVCHGSFNFFLNFSLNVYNNSVTAYMQCRELLWVESDSPGQVFTCSWYSTLFLFARVLTDLLNCWSPVSSLRPVSPAWPEWRGSVVNAMAGQWSSLIVFLSVCLFLSISVSLSLSPGWAHYLSDCKNSIIYWALSPS